MKYIGLVALLVITIGCTKTKDKVITQDSSNSMLEATPEEYKQATNEYGALTVQAGSFTGTSQITPWSSWWFPTKDKYLFQSSDDGTLAPLQKYDLYIEKTTGTNPGSALYEEINIYDASEVNWAGLCFAWSVASVLQHEPKNEILRNEIMFTVADQKAILLKSYEAVGNLKYYGKRNNAEYDDDFEDIYPEQFHRLAQVYLFDKKLPMLMDDDPSFPVWSVPVYNIQFTITKESETSATVQAWVSTASAFVDNPNFVGIKRSVKFYEYKLYGSWIGLDLHVTGSEWINDSLYQHPDFVIGYPENIERSSQNKRLDIAKIDTLLNLKPIVIE